METSEINNRIMQNPSLLPLLGKPLVALTVTEALSVLTQFLSPQGSANTAEAPKAPAYKCLPDMTNAPEKIISNTALAQFLNCSLGHIGNLKKMGYLDDAIVGYIGRKPIYDTRKSLEALTAFRGTAAGRDAGE